MSETNHPATWRKGSSATLEQHHEKLYLQFVLSYSKNGGRRSIKIFVSIKLTSRRP